MKVKVGDLVKTNNAANEIWNVPFYDKGYGLVLELFEDSEGVPYSKVLWNETEGPYDGKAMWYPSDALGIIGEANKK